MEKDNNEKYEKILFSIRMLRFHNFITDKQLSDMVIKLEKLIHKERNMTPEQISDYLEKIW